jgi:GGDEF domain-containing protein
LKTKTVKNLSTALVCVFIFALFILIGGFVYYYRHGLKNADEIFSALIEKVTAFSETTDNTLFQEQIESLDTLLALNDNLEAVSIRIGDTLVYGAPTLQAQPFLLKIFSKDFITSGNASCVVSAAIHILHPAEIFKSAIIAFLLVLTATVASVILIVYTKRYPSQDKNADATPSLRRESTTVVHIEKNDTEKQEESEPLTFHAESISKPEHENVPEPFAKRDSNFYSSETGFMRETFIERVLDPILINAASDNEDVAFMLIDIPGLDKTSLTGKEVCACIFEQIGSRERIFDHGIDSFAAILQNSDAAKAIEEATQLYRSISEKLGDVDPVSDIHIGIATKAFRRSVSAATLSAEARQAIAHAGENTETPIVAFKVNPEKYHELVEEA